MGDQLEPIEARDFSKEEIEWLNKITSIDYKGVDILKKQIQNAKVISFCPCGCKSIGLEINKDCPKFEYDVRVPIKMVVMYDNVVFALLLFHIKNGYIQEFEVLRTDSEPITEPINLENVTFDITEY